MGTRTFSGTFAAPFSLFIGGRRRLSFSGGFLLAIFALDFAAALMGFGRALVLALAGRGPGS